MSMTPPTLADLRAAKVPIEHMNPKGYIYALFHQDTPVYVGKAKGMHYVHQQIAERRRRQETFDGVAVIDCPVDELELVQAEYIIQFRPVFNDRLPPQPNYVSLAAVVRAMKDRGYAHAHRRTLKRAGIEELYLSSYRVADLKAGGFIS